MREKAKANISKSLIGKFGPDSRAWKGDKAGYVAIHLWVKKHAGVKEFNLRRIRINDNPQIMKYLRWFFRYLYKRRHR